MQQPEAVHKEGPRAPLFYWVAALVLPSLAAGQDAVERSELERCAALDTAIEKLACFESLADSRAAEAPAAAPETVPEPAPAAPAPVTEPMQEAPPPVAGSGPTRVPAEKGTDPSVVNPSPERRAAIPDAAADLGSEHLERDVVEDDKPETVSARVKEVWKGGNRLLYFQFTNGQVWRQMESGYFFYPRDREFDVTIRQGMMGDYQMRAEGRGRMTRIVRVR